MEIWTFLVQKRDIEISSGEEKIPSVGVALSSSVQPERALIMLRTERDDFF